MDTPLKAAGKVLVIASPLLFLFWMFFSAILGILPATEAVAAMAAVIFLTVLAAIIAAKVIGGITEPDNQKKTNDTPDS